MEILINLLVFALGLIIGSFLSVCIYRIPLSRLDRWYSAEEGEEAVEILSRMRKDISIAKPSRSFCPVCNHQLRWYENIPVLSWLMLGGKCGSCKSVIPFRYPVLELLTGLFALATVLRFGLTPTAAVIFIVICLFLVITFIDFDYYVIPDELSIRGSISAGVIIIWNDFFHTFDPPIASTALESMLGIFCGAGLLYFIYVLYKFIRRREGLGLGDVKLLLFTGILFGPEAVLYTIFVGSLIGSILGVALVIFGGRKLSSAIPFGPYLTTAATLYIFTGTDLIFWIIDSFLPPVA